MASIQALTKVAIRIPEISKAVLKQFSAFLTLKPGLSQALIVAIAEVLRRYPKEFKEVRDCLEEKAFQEAMGSPARCNALIMLATFGEEIPFAPYLLEDVVRGGLQGWDEAALDAALLASIKLFIKRPLEALPALRLVFEKLLTGDVPLSVRDKAAFYYRSMEKDFK